MATSIMAKPGGVPQPPALPNDYQLVQYLESDGGAWSYVNWTNPSVIKVDVELEVSTNAPETEQAVIGLQGVFEIYYSSGKIRFYGGTTGAEISNIVKGQKYTVTSILKSVYSDETSLPSFNIGTYQRNPVRYPFVGKIYSITNYFTLDNETIIVNKYVPVKRKSDSVAGWFDLWGQTFAPADPDYATSPWIAGPVVN